MDVGRRPPLRALMVFEAAARHRSFRLAARELHLTPSAVSHQMRALEEHLGKALFLRLHRGLRLTAVGSTYYQFVRDALDKLDEGTRALGAQRPTRTLRIRSGGSFAEKWLMPRLPLFISEHPNIELLLRTRTWPDEALPAEVDVEIRYGPAPAPLDDDEVEPLPAERILPLCSPGLLRGPDPLREPRDLQRQTLIESDRSVLGWTDWLAEHAGGAINPPRLHFDRSSLALQAAVYGLGVVLEGDFLASEELASGLLVTPFAFRETALRAPLRYLLVPRDKSDDPAVQAFRSWIKRELGPWEAQTLR